MRDTNLNHFILLFQVRHNQRTQHPWFHYPNKQLEHRPHQMRCCNKHHSFFVVVVFKEQVIKALTPKIEFLHTYMKNESNPVNEMEFEYVGWPWIASGSYLTVDKSTSSAGTRTRIFTIFFSTEKWNQNKEVVAL